jgi:hypothetical protein
MKYFIYLCAISLSFCIISVPIATGSAADEQIATFRSGAIHNIPLANRLEEHLKGLKPDVRSIDQIKDLCGMMWKKRPVAFERKHILFPPRAETTS